MLLLLPPYHATALSDESALFCEELGLQTKIAFNH